MSHSAENFRSTMLADDDMDDAEVLAPIGAAGATPTSEARWNTAFWTDDYAEKTEVLMIHT